MVSLRTVMTEDDSVRGRVVRALQSRARVGKLADHDDVEADLENLRAAVRELQDAVVILAEEIDRQR